jgi:hypothetical protein
MKIGTQNIIKIAKGAGASEPLRELKKGSEIQAHVLERLGAGKAVLDIYGRRVNAEFLKGTPPAATILLKLEDIKNNSLIFKIIEPAGIEESIEQILNATVFDSKDFGKNFFHETGRLLSDKLLGIFELNILFLGLIKKQEKKDHEISRFLNKLLKFGLSKDSLLELSIFLSEMRAGAKFILSVLMNLGSNRNRLYELSRRLVKDTGSFVDDIISQIGIIEDERERHAVIRQLFQFLSGAGAESSALGEGEIAFFEDDEFHPVRYIGNKNSWIFSIEFSIIGRIDILVKDLRNGRHISIFCARDDILSALRDSRAELEKNINSIRPPIYINYYNMQKAVNKIVEIYSYYSVNSVFDVRA